MYIPTYFKIWIKNLLSILLFLAGIVILFMLFNYILYGDIFQTVYASGPDNVIGHVINQDLLWCRLTFGSPAPGVDYDINRVNTFLNQINNNTVEYLVTHVKGELVQAIKVNGITNTVHPYVVKNAIISGLFDFPRG